jgi:hypothetical protein
VLFDDLDEIFSGKVATGEYAMSSSSSIRTATESTSSQLLLGSSNSTTVTMFSPSRPQLLATTESTSSSEIERLQSTLNSTPIAATTSTSTLTSGASSVNTNAGRKRIRHSERQDHVNDLVSVLNKINDGNNVRETTRKIEADLKKNEDTTVQKAYNWFMGHCIEGLSFDEQMKVIKSFYEEPRSAEFFLMLQTPDQKLWHVHEVLKK